MLEKGLEPRCYESGYTASYSYIFWYLSWYDKPED